MSYDELSVIDKNCKQLKVFRILSIPISLFVGFIIAVIVGTRLKDTTLSGVFFILFIPAFTVVSYLIFDALYRSKYKQFCNGAFRIIGISGWQFPQKCDAYAVLKSKQAVDNLDAIKFFKAEEGRLAAASRTMQLKRSYKNALQRFLDGEEYKKLAMYKTFERDVYKNSIYANKYYIVAHYSSPTGKSQTTKTIELSDIAIKELETDKSLLMSKSEYNRYLKEQAKEELAEKQHDYYEDVNAIIDLVNENKDSLVIKSDEDELDKLIASLFDRTINSIKKIKSIDSEEWDIIDKFITQIEDDVNNIIDKNNSILDYYKSDEFHKIKTTCDTLMSTQREFNEYIEEKVDSISKLFGTNVVRNETSIDDEYNYIHPYKKSITPFTAEVSSTVFASAENNPLDYVVKIFYPSKDKYPEQIQKLHLLIEELETLKEAKTIIDSYKADVQQYLSDVPDFILELDEDGFYSRLGFATINEKTLTVEYKFSYTSNGGKAQRSFTVPMTEETIVKLIEKLESKLTMSAFTKEQRALMTCKLRQQIKERDDFTCKHCGNSTHQEPNLLLEIDHIIPVSKGGCTEENNLQTLCWKCNRTKGAK
jgi:hypothetical protein